MVRRCGPGGCGGCTRKKRSFEEGRERAGKYRRQAFFSLLLFHTLYLQMDKYFSYLSAPEPSLRPSCPLFDSPPLFFRGGRKGVPKDILSSLKKSPHQLKYRGRGRDGSFRWIFRPIQPIFSCKADIPSSFLPPSLSPFLSPSPTSAVPLTGVMWMIRSALIVLLLVLQAPGSLLASECISSLLTLFIFFSQ